LIGIGLRLSEEVEGGGRKIQRVATLFHGDQI
jgi:hypothetical protein